MNSYDRDNDNELAEARLTAYALGELEGQERADVEAELAASETARQTVRSIQALVSFLREAARAHAVPPSIRLRATVEARLAELQRQTAAAEESEIETVRAPAVSRFGWQAWAAVAAAACLLIGAISFYIGQRGTGVASRHQDSTREEPTIAIVPPEKQPAEQNRKAAGGSSGMQKAPPAASSAEKAVPASSAKPDAVAQPAPPKTAPASKVPQEPPPPVSPANAEPGPSERPAPETRGQTPEPEALPPRSSLARQPVPDKLQGKATSLARLARSRKHFPADKPWLLGPGGGATGPVYLSRVPEAPRSGQPRKTAVSKGPAVPVAPGGFGSTAVRPGTADRGDGAAPSTGRGENAGKLSHAGEMPLFLPPGMRPDAKSSLPSKSGRNGKAAAKAKPSEPTAEDDLIVGVVENPFFSAEKFRFSTFSLDVDPEPYFLVDRALREFRHVPRADRVQIEDLVNYFPYQYAEPPADVPFSVSVEAAECPWNSRHRLVRVAIAARRSLPDEAGPQGTAEHKPGPPAIVAKDVKIQIEFNPGKVERYRLIGYDDSPTVSPGTEQGEQVASDLAAGHAVNALYEIVPAEIVQRAPRKSPPSKPHRTAPRDVTAGDRSEETLTVRLQYKRPGTGKEGLIEYPATDSGQSFTSASTDFRFAAAVASFGMILRRSQYAGSMTLKSVGEIAAAARGEDRDGSRARFLELVSKAQELGVGQ